MRLRFLIIFLLLVFSVGCAAVCRTGTSSDFTNVKNYCIFTKAELGMSKKEVQVAIGIPKSRSEDVSFGGKNYEEVWVYDGEPQPVLYFKNGFLAHKEYRS